MIRDLTFCYVPQGPPALADISLDIRPGSGVAVVGPSGAGKTTLVNLLLRFWDYRSGSIRLGGQELRELPQDMVRKAIAVVSQQTHLFNASVRDNLLLGRPDASEAEMMNAARQAQVHEFIQSLPLGYDTRIGELGLQLSGGQRQRLAIARALLRDSPILLLDEVTANLDAVTEHQVMAELLGIAPGRTRLFITHRLVGLDKMDQIVVLHAGRLVETGTHDELVTRGGIYRRMWNAQRQALD